MRFLVTTMTLVLAVGFGFDARAGERPPNIVLLYADDLGWADVGFNGRTEWATPNIDRLAGRGTVFKRWYTGAPICAPSRATMLTGKATIHCGVADNGADLPASEVTIAEALGTRGYVSGLFGKWHHGKPRTPLPVPGGPGEKTAYVHPMDQGFDEFFGFTDATHAWEKFPKTLWDGRERKAVSGYADDLFADRALDFIARRRDRPFFLYVPFTAPHFHIEAPDDEVARHKGKLAESNPALPLNATYAALVTRLDRNVGRIVDALEKHGLTGDTLIVFTSDHGATFEQGNQGTSNALDSNRPFRGQKRTLWEGGLRVPAIVCRPGKVPAGAVSHEVMHMTDLFPTFLDAAGGKPDPAWHVDGLNVLAAWEGKARVPDRTLCWKWRSEGGNQLAALRGSEKLVITNGGKPELYDVAADPAERRDLAAERPDVNKRLQKELKAWLATESPAPLP